MVVDIIIEKVSQRGSKKNLVDVVAKAHDNNRLMLEMRGTGCIPIVLVMPVIVRQV